MCLYPRLIRNRKYTSNKKNGGVIPAILDERVKYVAVGCTNCIECRKQKSREWQVRLLEDIKKNRNGKFVTLTFSDDSILKLTEEFKGKVDGYELDNQIATRAVRLFLERWRKKYKKSLRHWLVTELGHNGTENIHLHGIVWTDYELSEVEKIWGYGWVWKGKTMTVREGTGIREKVINYVNNRTVNYICKYVTKIDVKHTEYKSKILTSKGIGGDYTKSLDSKRNMYKGTNTDETYRTSDGHRIAMPVYWRNKIYSEEERENLWLDKLDKEERWILGNRVDISKGDSEYWEGLKYARKKNKILGYGSDEVNWEKKCYEQDMRRLKQGERLERAGNKKRNLDE